MGSSPILDLYQLFVQPVDSSPEPTVTLQCLPRARHDAADAPVVGKPELLSYCLQCLAG